MLNVHHYGSSRSNTIHMPFYYGAYLFLQTDKTDSLILISNHFISCIHLINQISTSSLTWNLKLLFTFLHFTSFKVLPDIMLANSMYTPHWISYATNFSFHLIQNTSIFSNRHPITWILISHNLTQTTPPSPLPLLNLYFLKSRSGVRVKGKGNFLSISPSPWGFIRWTHCNPRRCVYLISDVFFLYYWLY